MIVRYVTRATSRVTCHHTTAAQPPGGGLRHPEARNPWTCSLLRGAEAPWAGYDAEWEAAPHAAPQELYELWYGTIARCREEWGELVRDGGLDVPCEDDPGYRVNRRRRLLDILEENLLHTGQTSLVREAIDGLVGNDPP
jgi:hypothetical protein